jgi:hypothetical protein
MKYKCTKGHEWEVDDKDASKYLFGIEAQNRFPNFTELIEMELPMRFKNADVGKMICPICLKHKILDDLGNVEVKS